ncbi:MAG: ArsR family transcriptional regulator [Candidatus Methanoperedens sp.]|jgi:hypothetical protein|nr:ArsR family transcriptional regulator [Candidatus Methanoperedens sp.]PKL52888.1 MAG: transcriptional regulator [Candidatus Methanoperedenaceae archaeon HGW-Methanoperedenaceae-1]
MMQQNRLTTIFGTDGGIVALDSPVKLQLLDILKKGTTSFEDLVEQTGKAKSTISVHLNDLEKLNLVQNKPSLHDKRKKYFTLNSLYLAYSQKPMWADYNNYMDNFADLLLNGGSIKENLFSTMQFGMEAYGINPNPILKKMGNDFGVKIINGFSSNDVEGILNELSVFWKKHKMGVMSIIDDDGSVVRVDDCHHCSKMQNIGKTLCSMDEGIMEGLLSNKLGVDYNVQETECYGTGFGHCTFVIEEK